MRRALALLAAALLLPACTGEDKTPDAVPSSSRPATQGPAVPVASAKPEVVLPTGPAPTTLVQTDIKVGTGASIIPGQVVSVHYVGVTYDDGQEFDSSWETGHPFAFRLGNEDVIAGWDKGLLGMRVGGRRQLVIPPDLAYGASGHPLAGKTLVFVVDVISTGGAPAQVGDPQPTS